MPALRGFPRPARPLTPTLTLTENNHSTEIVRDDPRLRAHFEAVIPPSRLPPACNSCAFPAWRTIGAADANKPGRNLNLDSCVDNDGLAPSYRGYDPPVVFMNGRYTIPDSLLTPYSSSLFPSPLDISAAKPQPPPLPPPSSKRSVPAVEPGTYYHSAADNDRFTRQISSSIYSSESLDCQMVMQAGPAKSVSLQIHAPVPVRPACRAVIMNADTDYGDEEADDFSSSFEYLSEPDHSLDALASPQVGQSALTPPVVGAKVPIAPPPMISLLTLALHKAPVTWPSASEVSPISPITDEDCEYDSPISPLSEDLCGPLAEISRMRWMPTAERQMTSVFESWSSSGYEYDSEA